MKTYSELIRLPTFEERFNYVLENGKIGEDTFGYSRYLNQQFYSSKEWKDARREVIIRDDGCDLGISDMRIFGKIYVHHLNPITPDDLERHNPIIFDPENLITMSYETHNAIHYGSIDTLGMDIVERKPNDTCPWRQI